jgi:hypothetical protein
MQRRAESGERRANTGRFAFASPFKFLLSALGSQLSAQ